MVRPTFAAELVDARRRYSPIQAVGLALRDHRRRTALTQRAYAVARAWSKTHQHRLEMHPDELRLGQVVTALVGTGYELCLRRVSAEDDPAGDDAEGEGEVTAADWPDAELVARDHRGRRFPAHRTVRRSPAMGPDWWWRSHGTEPFAPMPEWTSGR